MLLCSWLSSASWLMYRESVKLTILVKIDVSPGLLAVIVLIEFWPLLTENLDHWFLIVVKRTIEFERNEWWTSQLKVKKRCDSNINCMLDLTHTFTTNNMNINRIELWMKFSFCHWNNAECNISLRTTILPISGDKNGRKLRGKNN